METKEKIKVTTIDELTPLIGKKVIVKDKEVGLFLTESGKIHAIYTCLHKQGPLSEGDSEWGIRYFARSTIKKLI